jgi:hypothetical protein
MWNRLKCYLSGHHEYGVWCEPGAIFLRCVHCGQRSSGWAVESKGKANRARASAARQSRVVKFERSAAH